MDKKTKISYSAVNTFKMCPSKYYYGKQYKMKLQASAFAFGAAVESGVSELLKGRTLEEAVDVFKHEWYIRPANKWEAARKIFDSENVFYYKSDYDKDLLDSEDLKQVDEWYDDIFDDEFPSPQIGYADVIHDMIKKGENPTEYQRQFYQRVTWLCCLRRGEHMIKAFKDQVLPQITKVHAVQKEIEIKNADGDKAMGFIDFILEIDGMEGPVIFDLKTAGRFYEEHDLQTTDQLRIYAAAEGIKNIGYIVLLKSIKKHKNCNNCDAKKPSGSRKVNCADCGRGKYIKITPEGATQILCRSVSDKEVKDVLHDFSDVLVAIKNNVRWRNSDSCMKYGTVCEFYQHCWGGKSLEDLDHLEKK